MKRNEIKVVKEYKMTDNQFKVAKKVIPHASKEAVDAAVKEIKRRVK